MPANASIRKLKKLSNTERTTAITGVIQSAGTRFIGMRPSNSADQPTRLKRLATAGETVDAGFDQCAAQWPDSSSWDVIGWDSLDNSGNWQGPQTFASFQSYDVYQSYNADVDDDYADAGPVDPDDD
jgi:hypothetical protein